ncbi:MAG TPA: MoxR family ATPase [Planctomycetota bacterium]|nr:MoxR family ATPase [Planctomycetota bacterium]
MSSAFGQAASGLTPLSPKEAAGLLGASRNAAEPAVLTDTPAQPQLRQKIAALIQNMEAAIVGKRETVKFTLVGLLARGHVLIEDVPGVGKTTLARALAKSIDCQFRRIQFTPDLLPSDIVGVSVFEQKESRFKFHSGPLFANVILADEINRTTPRTQSALLEAMNDFQVSVDGTTYSLPTPFIVLATQNPIEYSGTFSLPEAQLDRFLLRVAIGYPDRDSERQVLKGQRVSHPLDSLKPVISAAEVLQLQEAVRHVTVADALADYILEIAARTREHKGLMLGVSPRGCLMLYRAAQAYATIESRAFVTPDDIKRLALPVLGHRIIEKGRDAGASRKDSDAILREILDDVPVPI